MALVLAAAPAAQAAEARFCTVEAVEGPEALGWAAGEWSPLSPGEAVGFETKVSTGPETRVKITCDDGIEVTIGADTEVNLETLTAPGQSVILQLIDGIVGLLAPERMREFDVRTPVAIASVRSTEWLVEHERESGSAVFVRAGRVAVRARAGGQFRLGPGEGISIAADGTGGAVKPWGASRLAQSTAALGFDWQ